MLPGPWLKTGANDVMVLDLHATTPAPILGAPTLEGGPVGAARPASR